MLPRGLEAHVLGALLRELQVHARRRQVDEMPGRIDGQGQNREVDLDLFPTELFTRLDVSKSPMASQLEGGAAGTVNMRTARPFDNPGTRFNYQLQANYGEESGTVNPRGALTASWTNDTFGVLAGAYRGFSPPAPELERETESEFSINYEAGARLSDGPLRADIAHVLTKEDYDKTELFRFGASTKF